MSRPSSSGRESPGAPDGDGADGPDARRDQSPSTWEWAVAGAGAAVVVASIAILGWGALKDEPGPPMPRVEVAAVEPRGAQWLVRVHARNLGRDAALDVRVVGELRVGGSVVERAEATFDFLARGSEREAGMIFSHDPASGELVLRAESYLRP